jgi:hypothetical protein
MAALGMSDTASSMMPPTPYLTGSPELKNPCGQRFGGITVHRGIDSLFPQTFLPVRLTSARLALRSLG